MPSTGPMKTIFRNGYGDIFVTKNFQIRIQPGESIKKLDGHSDI